MERLIERLTDPRPFVRKRAVARLAAGSAETVAALIASLKESRQAEVRRACLWALARHETDAASAALFQALHDPDASVRHASAGALMWRPATDALPRLHQMVIADEASIRRTAAAVIGRVGQAQSVPILLKALSEPSDALLRHALIFALIEIGDPQATIVGLDNPSPRVRTAALIALDQMQPSPLTAELIAPLFNQDDAEVVSHAVKIIIQRKAWSELVADRMTNWLTNPANRPINESLLRELILAMASDRGVQSRVAAALARAETDRPTRLMLFGIIANAEFDQLPESWIEELRRGDASSVDLHHSHGQSSFQSGDRQIGAGHGSSRQPARAGGSTAANARNPLGHTRFRLTGRPI